MSRLYIERAEFTLFPKLVTELRLKIINFALNHPRVVELSINDYEKGPEGATVTTKIPALFHVDHETRKEAIKVYGPRGDKDKNGGLELEPQALIHSIADTIYLSNVPPEHLSFAVTTINSHTQTQMYSIAINSKHSLLSSFEFANIF